MTWWRRILLLSLLIASCGFAVQLPRKAVGRDTKPLTCLDTYKEVNRPPLVGLGTGGLDDATAYSVTLRALQNGYRYIDTAIDYGNEAGIGRAIRDSGVPREEIYVLTKCCAHACALTQTSVFKQFNESTKKLGLDYVDAYLIHTPGEMGRWDPDLMRAVSVQNWGRVNAMCSPKWPDYKPTNTERRVEAWRALETLYTEGRVRNIGVSNFQKHHLVDLLSVANIPPTLNEVEWHPKFHNDHLRTFMAENGIALLSYASLGKGIQTGAPIPLVKIAEKHGKTIQQVVLRWAVQQGVPVIPRSSKLSHLVSNFQSSEFELTPEDMETLCSLDKKDGRGCIYCSDFKNLD